MPEEPIKKFLGDRISTVISVMCPNGHRKLRPGTFTWDAPDVLTLNDDKPCVVCGAAVSIKGRLGQ